MKVIDLLKAWKDTIKERLQPIRPAIKGAIVVFLGIYLSRYGFGIGFLTYNIIFGIISYFLISLAALLLIKNFNQYLNLKFKISVSFLNLMGFGFLIIYHLLFYSNIFALIFLLCYFGLIHIILFLARKKRDNQNYIFSINSFIFSLGIIYGALLNSINIPVYIIFFFIVLTAEQFVRELTKDLNAKYVQNRLNIKRFSVKKVLTQEKKIRDFYVIASFQIIAIIFSILPPLYGIYNPIFYLYAMVPAIIFLALSLFFTVKYILTNNYYGIINSFIKWSIIFSLISLIYAS
ncbi:MAG: hypothetical protein ACTSVV_17675 [Promethearchaeota archaeon]